MIVCLFYLPLDFSFLGIFVRNCPFLTGSPIFFIYSSFSNSGLLFWGVVMAFIAAVSNLSNLATYLPFLNDLDSVSYAVLEGQLPVILLIVFMMLIPMIMT